MKKSNLKKIILYTSLILAGVVIGLLINKSQHDQTLPSSHEENTLSSHGSMASPSNSSHLWTCSMHPQIRESEPGDCPICGMDLISVSTMPEEIGDDQIQMTEAAMQLAKVQTSKVSRGMVSKEIRLQGIVTADERKLSSVTAHFDGRVEKLYADFTGQLIRKGQKLASLYSPDLVTAQKELFEALKLKNSNPAFYEAAIQKLKLWELTDSQINNIIEKAEPQYYFDVYAHHSGTVHTKNISAGEHIMEGKIMFEIADLNYLWILFEVYEQDLPWINVGDSIAFHVPALPGKKFQTKISFIDPVVNNQTRTVSIRADIDNRNNQLKPEMFAEGIIHAHLQEQDNSLKVPKSSVLWTGKRAIVYVRQTGYDLPTFQFREIQLGAEAGEHYVVVSGLKEGEEVATNGVFKIDASAQLQGKISMMNPQERSFDAQRQDAVAPASMQAGTLSDKSHSGDNSSMASFDVDQSFIDQLKSVFEAYLPVKDALVEGSTKNAALEARVLLDIINQTDMNLVEGEALAAWMKAMKVLQSSTEIIVKEEDLKKSRAALSPLSDQLYDVLVKYKVQGLQAFRQYCPMAFDFKGAYWLSNSDEILNPYFGDEMLTCGNIDDELP